MPFCTECGAKSEAGLTFCTACGARLDVGSAGTHVARTSIGVAEMGGFATDEILVLVGAGVAVLSFFLPWFSEPPTPMLWGGFRRPERVSGVGLFNVLGAWVLLEPLLAGLAAALVLLFRQSSRRLKIQAAGWQIFLGAPTVVTGVAWLFIPALPSVLSIGFYGVVLGYLGILVGGFLRLRDLAYEEQGVR